MYRVVNSNEILVISGKGCGPDGYKIQRGGAKFVIPVIQRSQKMSLAPFVVDIKLTGALASGNIRVDVPSTFTLAIDGSEEGMVSAAKRIIDLSEDDLKNQAEDIIMGQLRAVIAGLTIEEINADRDQFNKSIKDYVEKELAKLGLELINVNIKDISDSSGYIEAMGQKEEAQKKQEASIATAEIARDENIALAEAQKEESVRTAELRSKEAIETKEFQKKQIEKETQLEMEQIEAQKENKIKTANANKEIEIANVEYSKEKNLAESEAKIELSKKKEEEELAEKRATEVVVQKIAKEKAIIEAETEAEKILKAAQANADSIKLQAEAEAEQVNKIWEAKAAGLKKVADAVGKENLSSVLMIEQLVEVTKVKSDALNNLKIDKIVVWDNPSNGNGESRSGLNGFVDNFMGSIPAMHDLAKAADIKLPNLLGEKIKPEKVDTNIAQDNKIIDVEETQE